MAISIIGGGAWGTTLAQILSDNNVETLIYEVNQEYVELTNNHLHPIFKSELSSLIKATSNLKEVIDFSDKIILCMPSRFARMVLKQINQLLYRKVDFICASKGVEVETFKTISEIAEEEIQPMYLGNFSTLTGPSHAEETVLRKLTCFTVAGINEEFNEEIQNLFFNKDYIRVYTSDDPIGAEIYGASKNAIAIITGAITGYELGENLRAAVITRALHEMSKVAVQRGGKVQTAYGLAGIGDLIVTALSTNSRNFSCGVLLGKGKTLDEITSTHKQTIEGIQAIQAFYKYGKNNGIDLPLINAAYNVIFNDKELKEEIKILLSRDLKSEN